MTENRNVGVTEATIGLSLITGLLVLLGYLVLDRLSTSPRPQAALPANATFDPSDRGVRTALGVAGNQPAEHQTSYAPQWLEPQSEQPGDSLVR
jgi:energy-converting hydrogenase Eha subunit F